MFCDWLSKKTGRPYRLPTEAEWEYAARAGTTGRYYFDGGENRLDDYAWYEANSDYETQDVGLKKPNEWGLYDMLGNVWEFTYDYYDPELYKKMKDGLNVDPEGPGYGEGYKASLRGGSWDDFAEDLRIANRLEQQDSWNERDPQRPRGAWWLIDAIMVGFRVAIPAE
jgi:formylglycine-generating enzyme required for sulfatase activity